MSHTCLESNPWLKVDLGSGYEYVINRISIYNRNDCCMEKIGNSDVEILDASGKVMSSQLIPPGSAQNMYHFDFDNIEGGRYVRIYKKESGDLQIAEILVLGWSRTFSPTKAPTPQPTTADPTFEPTTSNMPSTLAPNGEEDQFNLATIRNLGLSGSASQSTTCYGGAANRAIDGNINGNFYQNSVTHTCNEENPWWSVDLGDNEFIINRVFVFNRNECCMERLENSNVEILDDTGTVVASQMIQEGEPDRVYRFDFPNISGRHVRVTKNGYGSLTIAELMVMGWSTTPQVINLARRPNAAVSQSSTCWNGSATRAVDGNTNGAWAGSSVTHTCREEKPWWQVELGEEQYVISSIRLHNRVDACCMDRITDSQVQILDSEMNVLATRTIATPSETYSFTFDNVEGGKYVRVIKIAAGTLQLSEVLVFGHPIKSLTDPSHYAVDGCISNGKYHENKVMSDESLLPANCCSGSIDDGSLTCSRSGCVNSDWLGANAHCESMGM